MKTRVVILGAGGIGFDVALYLLERQNRSTVDIGAYNHHWGIDAALAEEFAYRCKQAGQLCSKMRFMSAPWVGMLQNGNWLRHASHANAMARLLHELLEQKTQTSSADLLKQLIREQQRTHRLLLTMGWLALGFVLGLAAPHLMDWFTGY